MCEERASVRLHGNQKQDNCLDSQIKRVFVHAIDMLVQLSVLSQSDINVIGNHF